MRGGARRRRREAAGAGVDAAGGASPPCIPPVAGGRFQPLASGARDAVIDSAFRILAEVGMADAPPWLTEAATARGARLRGDGRLLFPAASVERAISRAARTVALPGSSRTRDLSVGGGHVHLGTGGAAVRTEDPSSGTFRETTLADLYRMMCVLDACESVHYGVRPLVACDMPDPLALDINTAYACLKATGKPIGVSFDDADHVAPVVRLFDLGLDGKATFREQPFCMGIVVHAVPPLRFAAEGVGIMRAAIEAGMPLQICSAGQAGATSPASLAGALAQGLAESLAGLMVVDTLSPGFPCIFALMPFVSDLRTGAMSGGSGEAAVAAAAAAQLLRTLDLPGTVSAGITDANVEDVQAGYEKGYSVALAAQAGADMINLSVGMLGSLTVATPEALLLDADLSAAILRTVRGVEVRKDDLDPALFERAVTGEGHYLGEPETLALMKSEYVYPGLADRRPLEEWLSAGRPDLVARARDRAEALYRERAAGRLSARADKAIRAEFSIHLPENPS